MITDAENVRKFSPAWKPEQARTVQAVACVTRVGQSDRVDVCHYRSTQDLIRTGLPRQVFLYRGRFVITVVEVRTARQLHRVEVLGDKAECPQTLPANTVSTHTELTADQLKSAIGHLIDS